MLISLAPMPLPAKFPTNVEKKIIDQLDGDFASLRNCALTCRAWLPRSRTLLLCAVRIATRSTWDAVEDYFQANPSMQPLVRSLATAPATQAERTRLLGTYPVLLFRMLPNLRRWEIRAPAVATDDPPPTIFFHQTTLTQLRVSPITELHLSSIQFPLLTGLVRLLASIPRLRVLECSEIRFARSEDNLPTALSLLGRHLPLSTLKIYQRKRTESHLLPCLLKLTALSLRDLVVQGRGLNWSASIVAWTMSELHSLKLHVDQAPEESVSTLFLKTFEEAASCVQTLRRESKLKELEIHIHMNDENHRGRTSCKDLVSMALLLSKDNIQNPCRELEEKLLADWNTHLTIVVHIPSSWAPREVVLRSLREISFPKPEEKGLLDVECSEGSAGRSYGPHHSGP